MLLGLIGLSVCLCVDNNFKLAFASCKDEDGEGRKGVIRRLGNPPRVDGGYHGREVRDAVMRGRVYDCDDGL